MKKQENKRKTDEKQQKDQRGYGNKKLDGPNRPST